MLIDSPPVLPVSDAMIISGLADITLLVCAADRTSTRDITRAVEQLRQVEAPLAGAILNGAGPESAYGGKYGYDTLEPSTATAPAPAPATAKASATAGAKAPRPKPAPRAPAKLRPVPRAKVAAASAKPPPPRKPAKAPRPAKPRPPARTQTK